MGKWVQLRLVNKNDAEIFYHHGYQESHQAFRASVRQVAPHSSPSNAGELPEMPGPLRVALPLPLR